LYTLPVAPIKEDEVSGFGLTAYAAGVAAVATAKIITAPLLRRGLQQRRLQRSALEELPSSAFCLRRMFISLLWWIYEATFTGTVQIATVA
jgi:hypothetical protein